jgi:hypothetical protein
MSQLHGEAESCVATQEYFIDHENLLPFSQVHYISPHPEADESKKYRHENAIFLDVKTQFVPHRRHVISPLQDRAS